MTQATQPSIRLGLRANLAQFALLMLINAFVGGMVGLERTAVPLIGTQEFHILLDTIATSFIISFGVVKACMNLLSGALADRYGRKRILVLGWLAGLPVPFLIMWAPSWGWIVAANVLLGINQGLAWSMAVMMKIDLVGPRQRGLAVGLNEFAGYLAVGLTALLTGYLASVYGLRPIPFYPGVGYAVFGPLVAAGARDAGAYAAGNGKSASAYPNGGPPVIAYHLCAYELGESLAVRGLPGGACQQPQRRYVLGPLTPLFRCSWPACREYWHLKVCVPRCVGSMSDRHWPAFRPPGAQAADRRWHGSPGSRYLAHRCHGYVWLVVGGHCAARIGNGNGLPGVACGGE